MTAEEKMWPDLSRGMQLEKMAEEAKSLSTKAWLYKSAATRYKIAKSWQKAASALRKSGNCCEKEKKLSKAANMYWEAGNAYWRANAQEAIPCFDRAGELCIETGAVYIAARYCREAGELYKRSRDYKHSLDYYKRAADLYEATEKVRKQSSECRRKAARTAKAIKREDTRKQTKMALTKYLFSPSAFVKCWVGQR